MNLGWKRRLPKRYDTSAVLSFNHDGLEIARVRKKNRWLPVWHVIFFVYLVLLIRLIAMADMGPAAYANRVAQLEKGVWIERMAARIMFMDPVSQQIAITLRRNFRNLSS